jgi:hypothetical protein
MIRLFPVCAALALSLALPGVVHADDYLAAADIKAMLANTVRTGKTTAGQAWTIRSNADGTQTIVAGSFKDKSTYVIRNNSSCETWGKIDNGKETCWRFKKVGDRYEAYKPDGTKDSVFTIAPQ